MCCDFCADSLGGVSQGLRVRITASAGHGFVYTCILPHLLRARCFGIRFAPGMVLRVDLRETLFVLRMGRFEHLLMLLNTDQLAGEGVIKTPNFALQRRLSI